MTKKFVPHENLSDEINLNIMQSEKDGGIFLKDMKIGSIIKVQTQNTLYIIKKISDKEYEINGNKTYCPVSTKCFISGSTWGGSMIKVGFIGIGMHLEFCTNKRITTSTIQSITIE